MSVVIVVFIILLVPSFLFLNFQRQEILRELAVEEETLKAFGVEEIERRILLLNTTAKRIYALGERSERASGILEKFVSLSGGIQIGEIKIDFLTKNIQLDGVAPTRNAFLAFERSLEESGFVEEISAPLSSLVKLTDVAFTLKGTLK